MVAPNSKLKVNRTMTNFLDGTPRQLKTFNVLKLIKLNATLENARAYHNEQDKFVFCLDLLDLCLTIDGDRYCDRFVNLLEDQFEELLVIDAINAK